MGYGGWQIHSTAALEWVKKKRSKNLSVAARTVGRESRTSQVWSQTKIQSSLRILGGVFRASTDPKDWCCSNSLWNGIISAHIPWTSSCIRQVTHIICNAKAMEIAVLFKGMSVCVQTRVLIINLTTFSSMTGWIYWCRKLMCLSCLFIFGWKAFINNSYIYLHFHCP